MVRAQYHLRMSLEGRCAWDVRRLIDLSRDLPVIRVPLASIRELDEPYWRNESSGAMSCRDVVDHARLLRGGGGLSHPVILSSDGRVMDGMHRICRALLDG